MLVRKVNIAFVNIWKSKCSPGVVFRNENPKQIQTSKQLWWSRTSPTFIEWNGITAKSMFFFSFLFYTHIYVYVLILFLFFRCYFITDVIFVVNCGDSPLSQTTFAFLHFPSRVRLNDIDTHLWYFSIDLVYF